MIRVFPVFPKRIKLWWGWTRTLRGGKKNMARGISRGRYPNFIHRDLSQQSILTSFCEWSLVPASRQPSKVYLKTNIAGFMKRHCGPQLQNELRWSPHVSNRPGTLEIGHFTNTLAWGPESSWKMRWKRLNWFHSFRGNKAQDLYCKYRGNIIFNFWNQNFWEFPSLKRGQTCEESPLTLKVAFFPQADSADNRQVR